ncbi:MAG: DctP family TRAP transporter solute-binding subunit [Planctomycetaceae bacterium]|nr:DctP family TRAP transporter solute-binding subunit [Planctomycetaceae bacterium]
MLKKVIALCALLCVSVGASAVDYPKVNLKMSTTVSEQSNAAVMCKVFADRIREETGGNIRVRVYPSDQLSGGNMSKGVEMIQRGGIDCAFEPVDVMAVIDQSLLALSIPWTYPDYAAAEQNLLGSGGDYIKKQLAAKGVECLGFIHNGFRQLTNNRNEVRKPEDLRGMKLRVPGGDVFVNFFSAFGADPVAMSFSELFTALQQGTVDGQENGFDLIVANKFYEVQKYLTNWNYSYGAFALVFNKKKFDSLTPETQELIRRVGAEVCRQGNQNVVDDEEKKKQIVIDADCKLIELSQDEIDEFKKLLPDYYAAMKAKYGAEACAALGIQ